MPGKEGEDHHQHSTAGDELLSEAQVHDLFLHCHYRPPSCENRPRAKEIARLALDYNAFEPAKLVKSDNFYTDPPPSQPCVPTSHPFVRPEPAEGRVAPACPARPADPSPDSSLRSRTACRGS